ncbi:MAG: SAM-dependent methyltransferase [Nanoarchaeota archaeon]
MKFIIEHLESYLYEWCLIEYKHISKIVGKQNLIFTNIKNKKEQNKLKGYGKIHEKSVAQLKLKNICILLQYSKKTLRTKDKFKYFVFGGILGDNPAKKRTNFLIQKLKNSRVGFETRNLGTKQMPTDAAVYVAKGILNGKKLNDFKFVDEVEIEINDNESVTLPFRYVVDDNKLIISDKLADYLRKSKRF